MDSAYKRRCRVCRMPICGRKCGSPMCTPASPEVDAWDEHPETLWILKLPWMRSRTKPPRPDERALTLSQLRGLRRRVDDVIVKAEAHEKKTHNRELVGESP